MSKSYWRDHEWKMPAFPTLTKDVTTNVAVIGGGITGLTAAYFLMKEGKKVILVERGSLGHGESGYTTAFLMYVTDASLVDLHGTFGDKGAKAAWQSGREAIDAIEKIAQEEKIDCDFKRCSAIISATSEEGFAKLKREHELMKEFGFPSTLSHEKTPLGAGGSLIIPGQAEFHPGKFMEGVVKWIVKNGGEIFEHSPVMSFGKPNHRKAVTEKGSVTARSLVIATHAPMDSKLEVSTRVIPTLTYAIAAEIPKGRFPRDLFLDTHEPYHYVRTYEGKEHDVIMVGGEDQKAGAETNSEERYQALEHYLRTKLLLGESVKVTNTWSGQILTTVDGLPFIGRSAFFKNHYLATGYAGNGMTFGVVAAKVISDLIVGKKNSYAKLYSLSRLKNIGGLFGNFIAIMKNTLSGTFAGSKMKSENLKPGEGAVIIEGGKKIAAYRSPEGKLTKCSAKCTHLGCTVKFNSSAKTWDCPCHGSRFTPTGEVMNGPAVEPLSPIEDLK